MSKPQTDREELKELNAIAREAHEKIDSRVNVAVNGVIALTPEELKARKRRNLVIALSIGAFMLLVFFITIAKLQGGALERPL
ncbi:MAG TPA: hypothetical protein PLN53_06070 [Terricaulis sp.]|nr:hypothetical protein [Terricaulis sp.]